MEHKYSEKHDLAKILDAFADYLSQNDRSENTIKTYCGVLQSFFHWCESQYKDVKGITKEDVQQYIKYLEKEQRSFSTIKKVINTMNTYAKSLNRLDLTEEIYYEETDRDTGDSIPEFLRKEEVEQLKGEIEKAGSKRNIAIFYTLLETGIRVSELCSLNRTDIEINHKNQTGQMVVKSRVEANKRTIPLTKSLVHHLKEYLKDRDDGEEALFVSNYKKRIAARTVQHTLRQYGVHPHKLRHTFCYNLVQKGLDLSMIAQLAGHSDIHLIKQYLKSEVGSNTDEKYA